MKTIYKLVVYFLKWTMGEFYLILLKIKINLFINFRSNFFSTFENIIKKSLIQNTSINSISNSNDLDFIKQLEQLNNLYKSGAITKEEFEKAKKKILN